MIAKIYATSCERDGKNFYTVPEDLQVVVKKIIENDGYEVLEDGTVVAATGTTSSEEEV